jgi:hypothetical protein
LKGDVYTAKCEDLRKTSRAEARDGVESGLERDNKMELLNYGDLSNSGSHRDGVPGGQERELRDDALILIKELAVKALLSQPVVATAQVYFHKVTMSSVLISKFISKVQEPADGRSLSFPGKQGV